MEFAIKAYKSCGLLNMPFQWQGTHDALSERFCDIAMKVAKAGVNHAH